MKRSFQALLILFCKFTLISSAVMANDSVPVPPKRPEILQVSPAYIEELKKKSRRKTSPKVIKMDEENFSSDYKVEMEKESDELPELLDMTKSDILDILDNKTLTPQKSQKQAKYIPSELENYAQKESFVPIPRQKPTHQKQDEGTENETTLISFALKGDQLHLDEHLRSFLRDHAVRLFNQDSTLRMEIQAYAKGVDGQKHSDVRLSLARALEVRSYLINQKIAPSRLKLSPLGRDKDGNNHDRIDLLFIK